MYSHPTPFQSRVIWRSLTLFAVVASVVLVLGVLYYFTQAVAFLQPVLIPFAIAAVLAFLLCPIVDRLEAWRCNRLAAVILLFVALLIAFLTLGFLVVPRIYNPIAHFIENLPQHADTINSRVSTWVNGLEHWQPLQEPGQSGGTEQFLGLYNGQELNNYLEGLVGAGERALPGFFDQIGNFLTTSLGGFLGVFGFLFNLIVIPVYLFLFLLNAPNIAKTWKHSLPLRQSEIKQEVATVLERIYGYLVGYFRGQLLVALIDGFLITVALLIMGLDLAFLVGLIVVIFGMLPYVGVILSLIPALLFAAFQFGDWQHPLATLIIFVVIQNFDGLVIAPWIIGDRVELNPLTVIVSIFFWGFVFGGLLGALLAVPLSASIKVLLERYVWRNDDHQQVSPAATETPAPG